MTLAFVTVLFFWLACDTIRQGELKLSFTKRANGQVYTLKSEGVPFWLCVGAMFLLAGGCGYFAVGNLLGETELE